MKKIGFALQIFGLVIMFPLIVILEMNHSAERFSAKNTTSGMTEKFERKSPEVKEKNAQTKVDFPLKKASITKIKKSL